MKHNTLICLILMTLPGSILSQVFISDALLNKSEMLKLNRGFSLTSGSLHKTSFGPFKTVDINKGKQHLIGRHNDPYLSFGGKGLGVKRYASSVNSQPYSVIILQDGSDTVISNMDLITVKTKDHALIEIGKNNSTGTTSESYCEGMVIQVKADTLNWLMPQTNDQPEENTDFPTSFDRVLTNGIDKILVKEADGFPTKRRIFENSTRGIVFMLN